MTYPFSCTVDFSLQLSLCIGVCFLGQCNIPLAILISVLALGICRFAQDAFRTEEESHQEGMPQGLDLWMRAEISKEEMRAVAHHVKEDDCTWFLH